MKTFFQKMSVGLATAALLTTGMATSVFADATISDNGAGSINTITLTEKCKTTVYQSNNTNVATIANVTASTGGNQANSNTGGTVTVDSGAATAGLIVTVDGSSNTATPPDCCTCLEGHSDAALITGNGAGSINTVSEINKQKTRVIQRNRTRVTTIANIRARTGHNVANNNTGTGASVTSDTADAGLEVTVTAPYNSTP